MLTTAFASPDDLAKRAAAARSIAKPDGTTRVADAIQALARAA